MRERNPAAGGASPSYLILVQGSRQRANEKGALVGVAYDFSKLVTQGLSAVANIGWGRDAIEAKTRAAAPDQTEHDLTIDCHPPGARTMWSRRCGCSPSAGKPL